MKKHDWWKYAWWLKATPWNFKLQKKSKEKKHMCDNLGLKSLEQIAVHSRISKYCNWHNVKNIIMLRWKSFGVRCSFSGSQPFYMPVLQEAHVYDSKK